MEIEKSLVGKKVARVRGEFDFYGASDILSRYCHVNLRKYPVEFVWMHGWVPDYWAVDPTIVLGWKLPFSQKAFTIRRTLENYLREKGYENVYAIGLPVVYLPQIKENRIRDSLLVMPVHSLDYTTHDHWQFDEYAEQIFQISRYFKYVYACIHPSCIRHGYWVKEFQKRGIKVVEGAELTDRNALYRLQQLMTTFEYVTTNGFGSHIAYAAYFGAKVSLYGTYAEFKAEDYKETPFYIEHPGILEVMLRLISEAVVKQELKEFVVHPKEAKAYQDWGEYQVGYDCKRSQREILELINWNTKKALYYKLKYSVIDILPEKVVEYYIKIKRKYYVAKT